MNRRKVLLIVAAIIAALGTMLVFLYVRSADNRAAEQFDAVQVLRAVKQINPGESVEAAQAAGKIERGTVAEGQRLPDALTDLAPIAGRLANTTIYPGEQIIASKFNTSASGTSALTIPKGKLAMSISLSDTARVAGFINPGDQVAIFLNGSGDVGKFTRLLLPKVPVIAIGSTTVVSTTTTDATGAQKTEQLPRTLFTVAVDQKDAQKIMFASGSGELVLGLINKDSVVKPGPGITASNLFN